MPTQNNESYQEYRDRVINKISPSFCAAKWLNSTIWLNNGHTVSCHHPNAHDITDTANGETIDSLLSNPSLIHNTARKKEARRQMLAGERPSECEYCWKIEDLGPQHASDRIFKTVIYDDADIQKCATEYKDTADVDLKTLEIAFDSNCNFGCSYCNASFSTTWQADIKTSGAYTNLISDGGGAYRQNGDWTKVNGKTDVNPYVKAFWDWWPKLSQSLQELRVTGGEATMSPDFWKLVDWWKSNPESDIQFAVNSNLGVKDSLLDKLIDATHSFKNFVLYSSCEAIGTQAEYIRDGLVWEDWKLAVHRLLTEGKVREFHIMMTINSLCLYSLTDFIDFANELKATYGQHHGVCSVNILRFPSFMSPGTLPEDMRKERADHIENWLSINANRAVMHDMEVAGIRRLINYLREVDTPHSGTSSLESRLRDFREFFGQYDMRRGKSFTESFPMLADWYNSLPHTEYIKVVQEATSK